MGLSIRQNEKGVWVAYGTVGRTRVRDKSMKTNIKKLADERRIELEWNIAKGAGKTTRVVTFEEAATDYRKTRHRGLGVTQEYGLGRAVAFMGKVPVRDVTPRMVGEYLNREYAAAGDSTRRRAAGVVSAVCNHAHECGWRDALRLSLPPESEGRLRWLTEAEQDAFLRATGEVYWPVFAFMLSTGARAGELVALNWEDVDGEQVKLVSKKGNTGRTKSRWVPLNGLAKTALAEQARLNRATRGTKSGAVFLNSLGDRWAGVRSFELATAAAAERAGIENFRLHDMRHTFASRLVQKGVALRTVSEMLGHNGLNMTTRYAHLAPGAAREAVELLSK